jgi:acetolactate synthase I/II/III large subunit
MVTKTGGEIIVDALIAHGVSVTAGLCGHGIIGLLDALYDAKDEIRVISVHHESVAGFLADAYFRVKHQPMATFTSCGPGSCNLPVAVASAQRDSSALLAITGNVPTSQWNRGPFQESGEHFQGDFVNVMRPYVKRSFQPTRVDMLPLAMRQAFGLMRSGRPGPVHIDVPLNVFAEAADHAADWPAQRTVRAPDVTRTGADADQIAAVADLLAKAERPVIVAGHGVEVSEAETELRALAERLGCYVATTPAGKAAFDSGHPLCLGAVGRNGPLPANAATREADVILAIGTQFDDRTTSSWVPGYTFSIPPSQLIHVDIDPAVIGRNYEATHAVVGDARTVLRQLLATAGQARGGPPDRWRDKIETWRGRWAAAIAGYQEKSARGMHPRALLRELRGSIPAEAIVLADVGSHHNWMVSDFPTSGPRSLLQSWGFAAMGFGVAGVLGARLAAPDRAAVTICGDGGFLMTASAVATAVEYDIPAVWVVWNNGGYISIRDQQIGYFGRDRQIATTFRQPDGSGYSPDFAAMAQSMGAVGRRITSVGDVGPAVRWAIDTERPVVIEVPVDPDAPMLTTGTWSLPPLPDPPPNLGWDAPS